MTHFPVSLLPHWIQRMCNFGPECYPLPGLPIVGRNLKMRVFTRADEDKRQHWAKFEESYLAKYNFAPRNEFENDRLFERLRDRLRIALDNLSGEMIGYICLQSVNGDPEAAELGICFSADQVSNGYGSEALRLFLPWAVNTLALNRIVLDVDVVNRRALRLYQRFGFRMVGETWRTEKNSALMERIRHGITIPGIRCRRNRLELLSWRMEWNACDLEE